MANLRGFRNIMIIYVVLMFLICLMAFILSGCAMHTGQVVFKGYQPPGFKIGYKPNRHNNGIVKGLVAIDESYYVVLKEGETYNKLEITKKSYEEIKKGDNYSSKFYIWNVEEWNVEKGKVVEELFNMEQWGK